MVALALDRWTDTKLLSTRICDLQVSIDNTPLEASVQRLYKELLDAGLLHFKPRAYLADEWFSPEGVPAIAIPFYLAHPRLQELEKATMGRVEGGNRAWCMRLLRHEAGHCLDHAYELSKTAEWRELFGNPRKKYDPHNYEIDAESRDFVQNLEDHYAQSHPDEDFAETFAVWLNPASNWRQTYRYWPGAYKKLKYIDKVARQLSECPPKVRGGRLLGQAANLRSSLSRYYKRRQKEGY